MRGDWVQISLDPPLRQGQTRYPYLVLEFSKEEEVDVELNLTESLPPSLLSNMGLKCPLK